MANGIDDLEINIIFTVDAEDLVREYGIEKARVKVANVLFREIEEHDIDCCSRFCHSNDGKKHPIDVKSVAWKP